MHSVTRSPRATLQAHHHFDATPLETNPDSMFVVLLILIVFWWITHSRLFTIHHSIIDENDFMMRDLNFR